MASGLYTIYINIEEPFQADADALVEAAWPTLVITQDLGLGVYNLAGCE